MRSRHAAAVFALMTILVVHKATADEGAVCCNRNGRYRVFESRGEKSLAVRVSIEASTNNKETTK